MMIYNLFPTGVGGFELGRDLSEIEKTHIFNLEQQNNEGNAKSANAWVLEDKNLSSLRSFLNNSLQEYFQATVSPQDDLKLEITQSWVNYTTPGQYHHKHAHQNSIISGVFYIQAIKEIDKLHFFSETYKQIKVIPKETHAYNSDSWWLPVQTGTLLLFPSHLIHMVIPTNETSNWHSGGDKINPDTSQKDVRISLSFNSFYKGQLGSDEMLTGLTI
jgi:hypothetical protein